MRSTSPRKRRWYHMAPRSEKLRKDTRGAVYVEWLAAFLPIFIMFECLVQMAGLYTAKLVVLHSASTAARAAVVVIPDDPQYYDNQEVGKATGKRREKIKEAAAGPLRAVRSVVNLKVSFPSSAGGTDDRQAFDRDDLVRVRVEVDYRCQVPFASRIVCNPFTQKRKLTAEAALPNNGADYEYQ